MPGPTRQSAFDAGLLGIGAASRGAQTKPGEIAQRASDSRVSSPSRAAASLRQQGITEPGRGIGTSGSLSNFINSQPRRLKQVKRGLSDFMLAMGSLFEAPIAAQAAEELTGKELPISDRLRAGPSTSRQFFERPKRAQRMDIIT